MQVYANRKMGKGKKHSKLYPRKGLYKGKRIHKQERRAI